jgi:hypothetical protein
MAVGHVRISRLALVCAAALATGLEARAQSASASASAASAASANNFNNMTMGLGFMPMPGMFGSASPSATDAAALGVTTPQQGGMMGTGGNNMFMNPMASPFLYGSMFPMTQQQQGMMMLAGQAQMLGIGSGRMSGTRPGSPAAPGTRGRQLQAGARGSTRTPGGLAARYFNRTTTRARIPQGFYNRPNQHYPQVGR